MHKGLSVLEAPMVRDQDQRSSHLQVGVSVGLVCGKNPRDRDEESV